jgi:hypothetical protein
MAAAAGVLFKSYVSPALLDEMYVPIQYQVQSNVRHCVCSSSDGLVTGPAVPNANGVSLDGGLAAEGADVSGVLGDFHLLDLLSEGGTVSVQRKSLALRCRMSDIEQINSSSRRRSSEDRVDGQLDFSPSYNRTPPELTHLLHLARTWCRIYRSRRPSWFASSSWLMLLR